MSFVSSIFRFLSPGADKLDEIDRFQHVAVEDLKRQILGLEKRFDEFNAKLDDIARFQRVATEDLKTQIFAVEQRLDHLNGTFAVDSPGSEVVRDQYASVRQILDKQSLAILRLTERLERSN